MFRVLFKILITIFKYTSYIVTGGLLIAGLIGLTFFLMFSDDHPPELITQATSPDGKAKAIFVQFSSPAFSSDIYNVYIVPKGQQYAKSNIKLSGKQLNITRLFWLNEKELFIKYDSGHVTYFDDCGLYIDGLCQIKLHLMYVGNIKKEIANKSYSQG